MIWNDHLKKYLPAEWNLLNTSDISTILTGKEDANHSTKNGIYPFFTCSNDILKCDDYKFDGNSILIAGNGDFNVKHYNGKFNAYQRTYVIQSNDKKYVGVLYQNCLQTINKFKKGSNGSIVKFITLKDIQNISLLDPHNDLLLTSFNNFLSKIDSIKEGNSRLIELRDFLLPLLMNGQATIE